MTSLEISMMENRPHPIVLLHLPTQKVTDSTQIHLQHMQTQKICTHYAVHSSMEEAVHVHLHRVKHIY